MSLKVLSREDIFSQQPKWRDPGRSNYLAMFSSVFGGVVKDPALMLLPMDDHMVHRGDGIFEALECVNGYLYNLDAHLSRLKSSAGLISLNLPFDLPTIKKIIIETVAIAGAKDCIVRVFISRGLGGFSCKPTECQRSNLYVVVLKGEEVPQHFYTRGVSAVTSKVPIKPAFFARVKSCNYLPNALVHLEAHQNKVDFAIVLDQEGNLAEGATESVAVVNKKKIFMYPRLDNILKGTTLLRAVQLAQELIKNEDLRGISCTDISLEEAYTGSELLIFGTGINVVPVVTYDGKRIGSGKPGPIFRHLLELFQKDRRENKEILTPIPYQDR